MGLYLGCKALTLTQIPQPFHQQGIWIYLLAWPGMNGVEFLNRRPVETPNRFQRTGVAFLVTGLGVLMTAGGVTSPTLKGLLGMCATVFVLHFGLFRILADAWTAQGWQAPALMRAPFAASSLTDFWGRRWNRAFRDLTHQFLFRPLTRQMKPMAALLAGFLGSGLVHELVITLPAGGGYGGPTAYFLLQGVGILGEKRMWPYASVPQKTWIARLILLLPLPLLFPPAFLHRVMAPFVIAIT